MMPRRDGYPTNQELLTDLTTASHEAFARLYEVHMQDGLPPAFEGKPLNSLGVCVTKQYFEGIRPSNSVQSEILKVTALDPYDIDHMEHDHPFMCSFPPDVFEYYRAITRHIAHIALTSSLELRSHLPPAGVISDYSAHYPDGSTRHVDTLSKRPAKMTIMAGRYFVEEVYHYITSGQSQVYYTERLENASASNEEGVIDHYFTIALEADVPLNGYEDTDFLIAYRNKMHASLRSEEGHFEKLQALGASRELLDHILLRMDTLKLAAQRAQTILDQRQG